LRGERLSQKGASATATLVSRPETPMEGGTTPRTMVEEFGETFDEISLTGSIAGHVMLIKGALERPQTSSSNAIDDDDEMDVLELPPELGWLNRAKSLPGAVPFDENDEYEPEAPHVNFSLECSPPVHFTFDNPIECRATTPFETAVARETVRTPEVVGPAAVAGRGKRSYLARPVPGATRAKLPKGKSWSWRSKSGDSPRGTPHETSSGLGIVAS